MSLVPHSLKPTSFNPVHQRVELQSMDEPAAEGKSDGLDVRFRFQFLPGRAKVLLDCRFRSEGFRCYLFNATVISQRLKDFFFGRC
jgi:hypothetical protein